tara:strand:+ start:2347 stop:2613 length:267 start_codon:yes stop_codon:yes gene_type:complete
MEGIEQVLSENAIKELEDQIPARAAAATRLAYENAKKCGYTVVLEKNGYVVAEYPNGTEQILFAAKPRRKVVTGVWFQIRALPRWDKF